MHPLNKVTFLRILLWAAIALLPLEIYAQRVTVSGRVVDQENGEPLVFASIGIAGKSIGTITNLAGEFDFHMPEEYVNQKMTVSMIGYAAFSAPVADLIKQKPLLITLPREARILEELVISDSLNGGDVLRIAISRIDENYPMQPFLLDAFYRDTKQVGGTYVSMLEAAVQIYDEDYREPRNKFKLRERVRLVEVRRSLGYNTKFTAYFDEGNLLQDLLLHNNVRYRQFPDEELFFNALVREKDSYYNGEEIFVVTHYGAFKLRVFVNKTNYSILRLEYETEESSKLSKKRGLESRFAGLKRVLDFKEHQGKMYLNYLTIDSKINWYDIKTGELKFETELNQQLLVNNVYPDTPERIGTTQKMRSYGLQFQDQPYNKAFWDNYNVIKESPLDKKIQADLEKHLSLEKQFEH